MVRYMGTQKSEMTLKGGKLTAARLKVRQPEIEKFGTGGQKNRKKRKK